MSKASNPKSFWIKSVVLALMYITVRAAYEYGYLLVSMFWVCIIYSNLLEVNTNNFPPRWVLINCTTDVGVEVTYSIELKKVSNISRMLMRECKWETIESCSSQYLVS